MSKKTNKVTANIFKSDLEMLRAEIEFERKENPDYFIRPTMALIIHEALKYRIHCHECKSVLNKCNCGKDKK